jgi:uncharacterized protein
VHQNGKHPYQSVHSRERVLFDSGGTTCVAWHYPGSNGACIVMAGGLAMPKEPGTDLFAARFHSAGYSVLAFDYRFLGESGGSPRGIVRVRDQIADWHRPSRSRRRCRASTQGAS